jgi:hypothetical protein
MIKPISKTPAMLLGGIALGIAALLLIVLFTHDYWATFIPRPSWKTWRWVLLGIYVTSLASIIFLRVRQIGMPDGPMLWKFAGGCLLFGWLGVDATLGLLAVATGHLPRAEITHCGLVTEHKLPIESIFRRVHYISAQLPDYSNANISFAYNRNAINIDNVHQGDSILISGQEGFAGLLVRTIVRAKTCSAN